MHNVLLANWGKESALKGIHLFACDFICQCVWIENTSLYMFRSLRMLSSIFFLNGNLSISDCCQYIVHGSHSYVKKMVKGQDVQELRYILMLLGSWGEYTIC